MQKKGSLQELIGDLSNTLCSFNVEKTDEQNAKIKAEQDKKGGTKK